MKRSATLQPSHSGTKGLVIGISLIVLALVVAIIAANPGTKSEGATGAAPAKSPTATAAPQRSGALRAREAYFEFGPISMASGKVSHRYWFRNESAAPVLIRQVYTSCMCTTATLVKGMRVIGSYGMPGHGPMPAVNQTLAPDEAAYVDVVFDPAAHGPAGLGRTERVVTIEPGAGAPLQVGFTAYVKP
jgi:Protein of unknown function (DUF1573)